MRNRIYCGSRYSGSPEYSEPRCEQCNGMLCDHGKGEREGWCRRCSPPTCAICEVDLDEDEEGPVCDACAATEAEEEEESAA